MSKDTTFIRYMNPFNKNPSGTGSQKTWERKVTRNREVLIWNSNTNGTFKGNVKQELINN